MIRKILKTTPTKGHKIESHVFIVFMLGISLLHLFKELNPWGGGYTSPLSKMHADLKLTYTVFIQYEDSSNFSFEVTIEGNANKIYGELLMITRGTLMASNAEYAVAYNDEGFDVCSYRR